MNEITLTVIAQIFNFFLIWYVFHTFLLKKIFNVIKTTKEEVAVLDYSINLAREGVKREEERKREEWEKFRIVFSQKMPLIDRPIVQHDITPLCHVAPGLESGEKKKVVQETVAHLVRKIAHES